MQARLRGAPPARGEVLDRIGAEFEIESAVELVDRNVPSAAAPQHHPLLEMGIIQVGHRNDVERPDLGLVADRALDDSAAGRPAGIGAAQAQPGGGGASQDAVHRRELGRRAGAAPDLRRRLEAAGAALAGGLLRQRRARRRFTLRHRAVLSPSRGPSDGLATRIRGSDRPAHGSIWRFAESLSRRVEKES